MYSVFRILAEEAQRPLITELVTAMNARQPGTFEDVQTAVGTPAKTSCELLENDTFLEHVDALTETLAVHAEELTRAKDGGLKLVFELSVDSDALRARSFHELAVNGDLMKQLIDSGISLAVNVFSGGIGLPQVDVSEDEKTDPGGLEIPA